MKLFILKIIFTQMSNSVIFNFLIISNLKDIIKKNKCLILGNIIALHVSPKPFFKEPFRFNK